MGRGDWVQALRRKPNLADHALQQEFLDATLVDGRLLIATCYDDDDHEQGFRALRVNDGPLETLRERGIIECDYLGSSDQYYRHWAEAHQKDPEKTAYHLCHFSDVACGDIDDQEGLDGREIIHLWNYRLADPTDFESRPWAMSGFLDNCAARLKFLAAHAKIYDNTEGGKGQG